MAQSSQDPAAAAPGEEPRRPSRPSQAPAESAAGLAAPGPYEPNRVLRWLYEKFFVHISVDGAFRTAVQAAARRGTTVYVMRSISFLDFLCLDFFTKQFGLPLIRFVNDLGLGILEPFGKGRRRLRLRRQVPEDKALRLALSEGASALLFLRKPPRIGRAARHGEDLEVDLIRTLIDAQRSTETPILLVPQTFVWRKRPAERQRTLWDLLFGPREWPGRLRVLLQFVLNYRNALLRSGEPFDLQAFLGRNPDLPDERLADKVRYALLTRIERERTLVVGPERKTPGRLAEEILRSPRIKPHLEAEATRTGASTLAVTAKARKELDRLAATQEMDFVKLLETILYRVWHRIYDGIEIDKEGVERIRAAARKGPLVLLPSHKSHVDYLVLSYVLFTNDISPPLVAAGDNLSFWPLGAILRRGGAFFIRRSFKGKKLYSVLVSAYIRKLLSERFNIEFFVEGGRSRTGKLLPPKLGLLSMVVESALQLRHRHVQFVPISIGYESIIEARSYVEELTGGEKKEENIGGLLQTPRILRRKYGKLYVQVGEIIPFERVRASVVKEHREFTPSEERTLTQRIAYMTVDQINRVTMVTPASLVASAILTTPTGNIDRETIGARAQRLSDALRSRGARFAPTLLTDSGCLRDETVDEAIRLFTDARLVQPAKDAPEGVWFVPDERRIALEYFKNNIIHFFVASALIAAALCDEADDAATEPKVKERVARFSRMFKYEFMFRADASFEEIFRDALDAMVRAGEIERDGERLRRCRSASGGCVDLYADGLRTYFESYHLALRGAELLREGSLSRKDWLKRCLSIGQRMYLAGEIERRESVSKPRLENALRSFHDLGIVKLEGERVEAGPELAAAGAAEMLRHRFLLRAPR